MTAETLPSVSPFDWIATATIPTCDRYTFDMPAEALLAIRLKFAAGEPELMRDFAACFAAAAVYFGMRNVYSATAIAIGNTESPTNENWLLAFIGWDIVLAELRSLGMSARVEQDAIFHASALHLWALNTAAGVVTHVLAPAIESAGGSPFKTDGDIIELANHVLLITQATADEIEQRIGAPFSHLIQCT